MKAETSSDTPVQNPYVSRESKEEVSQSSDEVEKYKEFVEKARNVLGMLDVSPKTYEFDRNAVPENPSSQGNEVIGDINRLGEEILLKKQEQPFHDKTQEASQGVVIEPQPSTVGVGISEAIPVLAGQGPPPVGGVAIPGFIPEAPLREAIIAPGVQNDFQMKVREIKDKIAADNNENNSTQSILRDALSAIQLEGALNARLSKISSKLNRNAQGEYAFETFTTQTDPRFTCYKIKSTYSIVVKNEANEEETISFDRYIYTSAKIGESMERPLFAASKYKDFMIELARAPIDDSKYRGRVQNYPANRAIRAALMEQRLFGVNFNYKKDSSEIKGIATLNLNYSDDKNLKEMSLSLPYKTSQNSRYVGDLSDKTLVPKKSKKQNLALNEFYYKTKEEALKNTSCVVSDSEFLTNLELTGETEYKIKTIYENIKKNQEEFNKLRKEFFYKDFFISSEKETPKFEEIKTVIRYFHSSEKERMSMENKTLFMTRLDNVNQELKGFEINREELEKELKELEGFLKSGHVLQEQDKNKILFLKSIFGANTNKDIADVEKTVSEQDIKEVIDQVNKKISQMEQKKNLEQQIYDQYNEYKKLVASIRNLKKGLNHDIKQLNDIHEKIKGQLSVVKVDTEKSHLKELFGLVPKRKIEQIKEKIDTNSKFIEEFDVLVKKN